jgi:PIN domain nuclease of toxin-antitoxin system
VSDLLLDTHVFIWYTANDPRLDHSTRQLIDNQDSNVYLSVVSGWEIAIKLGLGKLLLDNVAAHGLHLLDVTKSDILAYSQLSFPLKDHRDPFDRMLAVQAREHNLMLVTADAVFKAYLSTNLKLVTLH